MKQQGPGLLLGDLKRYTANTLIKKVQNRKGDKRAEQWLKIFKEEAAKRSNVKHYQLWQHDNHPIQLWSPEFIRQKINYIHQNPVKAGMVKKAEDYPYSSAKVYMGGKGLLDDILIYKL